MSCLVIARNICSSHCSNRPRTRRSEDLSAYLLPELQNTDKVFSAGVTTVFVQQVFPECHLCRKMGRTGPVPARRRLVVWLESRQLYTLKLSCSSPFPSWQASVRASWAPAHSPSATPSYNLYWWKRFQRIAFTVAPETPGNAFNKQSLKPVQWKPEHCQKKLKKVQINGQLSCVHRLGDLALLPWHPPLIYSFDSALYQNPRCLFLLSHTLTSWS